MVSPEAYYDSAEGVEIFPTGGGAHNWSPMSWNPATGLVYINASYSPFLYQATEELKPGTTGYVRPSGEVRHIEKSIGPVAPDGVRGGLQAWDPVNQKLAWRADGGGGIGGGTVTTAGNLVFQVVNDGTFRAFSADKGEKLFEAKTGRTGMGAPITYEAGGKQYVAFMGVWAAWPLWREPTNERSIFRRCCLCLSSTETRSSRRLRRHRRGAEGQPGTSAGTGQMKPFGIKRTHSAAASH